MSRLSIATEALRVAEVRGLAGQFALEIMDELPDPLEAVGYLMHLATDEQDSVAIKHLRLANEQMETVYQIAAQALGFAPMSPTPQEVDLIGVLPRGREFRFAP